MKSFARYILLFIGFSSSIPCFTQDTRFIRPVKYTPNDGLSSYFITRIIKDSYGFLWVGSQEGLNVFDGNRFQVFSKQSPEASRLDGSFVSDLAEDKKRKWLWVLLSYGGLCAIDLQTRTVCKRIPLEAGRWNRCLSVQGDTVWIGGLEFITAYDIVQDKFVFPDIRTRSKIGTGEFNISKIAFDGSGRMIIFSDGYGMVVLDDKFNAIQRFDQVRLQGKNRRGKLRFWDIAFHKGKLFVATSWGLQQYTAGTSGFPYRYLPDLPGMGSEIRSISVASDASLLFSNTSGFYASKPGTSKIIAFREENADNDWFKITHQIYYDSALQRVWLGTLEGLETFSIADQSFEPFSKSSTTSTRIKHLFSILPISGEIIYCGDENGLYHVNQRSREIVMIDTSASNLMLFRDQKQNILASNKNGLHVLSGKKVSPAYTVYPTLKSLDSDHLSCGIQYNDSLVIFGSIIQKGLTLWNTRTGKLKTFHQDSAKHPIKGLTIINYLYKTRSGEVLILTEKSIIAFNPITYQYTTHYIQNTENQQRITNFMDACETSDRYWVATYGDGVLEIDKEFRVKKMISSASGLNNNCVYRIFSFEDNSVIATTNKGLSVIHISPYSVKNYYQSEGLHANEFEQLCGYQDGSKILAGGVNGFTIIDPSRLPHNSRAPDLYFQQVRVNSRSGVIDTTHINMQEMTIPTDALQTTIAFSALNYSNPTAVRYAYKIRELNNEWIPLETQNFVNLIGLSPGTYTFDVRASNEDGIWTKEPRTLKLVYLPTWYQTDIFKIAVLIVGALLIYALQLFRIGQLKKQQKIRKDIGNDLHDDIGSTLNTLKIFTHLAKHEPKNKAHLNQIEESISQATSGLRDMIWVLEDSEDRASELVERIKKFALPVCIANNIQFRTTINIENNAGPLLKTEKRNLLLIAKETINNSIKYSRCGNIDVSITQTRSELQLTIADDGVGFSYEDIEYGKGLKSIQYRARQIFFKIDIGTSPGKGTTVMLTKIRNKRFKEFLRTGVHQQK